MKTSRDFVLVQGQEQWGKSIIQTLFSDHIKQQLTNIICCGLQSHILGEQAATYISSVNKRSSIENQLGSEYSILIYNCYSGFNPNLFCSLTGLIKFPGMIILITPGLNEWPAYTDPDYSSFCSHPFLADQIKGNYITYLIHKIHQLAATDCYYELNQNQIDKKSISTIKTNIYDIFKEATLIKEVDLVATTEQQNFINSIHQLNFTNQKSDIHFVQANRGRGKSSAIGIAINNLINQAKTSKLTIAVVSQNKVNADAIFSRIAYPGLDREAESSIVFYPPDEFLSKMPNCDLLIIDEAAAIPLTILNRLIESTAKIVMASTMDGYEGTGMGLSKKLIQKLENKGLQIKQHNLTDSQRWQDNDLIENFIFDAFLAKNKASQLTTTSAPTQVNINDLTIQKVDRTQLSNNTDLLSRIFQLLAQAHYRTTPDDFRYILDAPDAELWIGLLNDDVCAVLLACHEGQIESHYLEDIWLGRRRLKGHLLPQAISSQCGFKQAPKYSYKRIIRLAVSQHFRRRGIATKLVNTLLVSSHKSKPDLDYLGVSYGYEPGLHQFWQKVDFKTARLGQHNNARSGLKSMIMLMPISKRADSQCVEFATRFHQLEEFNRYMATDRDLIPIPAMTASLNYSLINSQQDQQDIFAFAYGNRQYLDCLKALYQFSIRCLNSQNLKHQLDPKQIDLLTLKILLNKDWNETGKMLNIKGKKQIIKELRQAFSLLYSAVWGNKS